MKTVTLWCGCEIDIPADVENLDEFLQDAGIVTVRNEGPKEVVRCTTCGKERSE